MKSQVYAVIGGLVLAFAVGRGIRAGSSPPETRVEVRKTQECTVLYTLHRGSFDKMGAVIGEAIGAAAKKGVYPRGSISLAYLNNFETTPQEHWLMEIRIPVGDDALKLAGTLGKFTDVKKLPSMEVAVARKPEGMATPEAIYRELYAWMFAHGYLPVERPAEVFLTNAQSGDYARMSTEILIPVIRVASSQ